jgi:hypothetical protein
MIYSFALHSRLVYLALAYPHFTPLSLARYPVQRTFSRWTSVRAFPPPISDLAMHVPPWRFLKLDFEVHQETLRL